MSTASNTNNRKITDSQTITSSKVTLTNDMLVLQLGGSEGAWTLKTTNYAGTDGYLASATGSNNQCRVISSSTSGTITFSSDAAVINLQPNSSRTLLRYNSGSSCFACYSSGQNAIYLFKEVVDDSQVKTPTFSPEGGNYTTAQSVEISTTTDGATIYYTTDGTTPTTSSSVYSSPINVSSTTTIKALATKTDMTDSDVATATYNFPLVTIDEIFAKATAAASTATECNVTFNNWVVSGVSGSNVYVTDGTKGFIIYKYEHGFSVGDVLSGTITAHVKLYNGSAEFTDITSSTTGLTVTSGTVPSPTVVNIEDLSGVNTGAPITVNRVTYDGTDANLSDGTNTITPYNEFEFDPSSSFKSGSVYNVTGIYIYNNGNPKRICPRSAEDIEEDTSAPSCSASPSSINFGTVAINGSVAAKDVTVTLSNTTYAVATLSGTNATAFEITAGAELTASGTITVRPVAATLTAAGTYSASLDIDADGVSKTLSIPITLVVEDPMAEKSFEITVTSQGISTNYSTLYSHEYTLSSINKSAKVNVDAKGVYYNTGIQMNTGKGTYIKNTVAIPGVITKIVCTWKASGKNSPTIYMSNGSVASTSSTKIGEGSNSETTQTYTVENPETAGYNYFYFDGTTVSGSCIMTSMKVYYIPAYTKTISARKMATMYLPYAVTIPSGAKAYIAEENGTDAVKLTKITEGQIPANTGVIVYADVDAATDFDFAKVTYSGTQDLSANCLKGVAVKTAYNEVAGYDATNNNYYALMAKGETEVEFQKVSSGNYAANSAYLVLPAGSSSKIDFTFDDATGIQLINDNNNDSDNIYNLKGMKVDANYKGIVIKNGKKYLNK